MSNLSPSMVKLRGIITDDMNTWDQAWEQNVTPWETGTSQPPLLEVLRSGEVPFPRSGRAFVPGCGSGHDAISISAELGVETLAGDISAVAVKEANKLIVPEGLKVRFEVQDFFAFEDSQKFDLIYDYTFFVAIPPSMRMDWGKQINALIKPGGYLITLVFPLDPESDAGPPFFVRPEHYLAPLGEGWEKVVDRIPTVSSPTHVDRERIIVWRKLEPGVLKT
ncbi:S-adenosyl-L-methionine-dependent methyltransferase [Roridomyces roridus]|uniref:S-adenosyl-L-methionine-dependent methyltransferase n=1 Tax=Roridomyces roridus TaxID=1738132 RepID=A0AAD7AYE3_9AGAR|nr:S-adenosyl-L-methionine-dependent methyltransferase [Roridomyces roridus]